MVHDSTVLHQVRTYVRELSKPLADITGVPNISQHADVILVSCLCFTFVRLVLSPILSTVFFPISYGQTGKRAKHNWDVHVVSLVNAVVIIYLAGRCLNIPILDEDRAFGWHDEACFVQAVACGYFLWDSADSLIHFTDIGFVFHGFSCLAIYGLGLKPFLFYYGVRFLFWELSTIFLNIHWFLDKTGKTGSILQLVNGAFLLCSFASVRLIWGGKMSYEFFQTLYSVRNQIPFTFVIVYGVGNIVLQTLNWLWFMKMISALRKRFPSKPSNRSVTNGNGKHK
ncbi:hypothetical protein SERLA73DRAFT_186601 [Serpula lacrymans var. lacrymans S7.3]|uniref:TLC domain-containing protein n=2 Tax=Serpula lacrymans var. lacrymans TaxID=341189 RepID=F8Q7K1_SERL3|nr:uncharacterized protein SERLADRAFT_475740 [Serpula lacrymans var. lacrymans S7.9]EGN95539.1 hypothetical protein SERLA73DRAFT_186601 [Serpula lacrymans var. lacrymans S7.3]EGO21065.1 hypothetical protein SERLADRAFT_475740 [Serpula lacrymans var. lacrymans S7.9]